MKTHPDLKLQHLIAFDNDLVAENHYLIGIDEAGRGPLCGPVVAAAAILIDFVDDNIEILKYLDDSKKFSGHESLREEIYDILTKSKCIYSIAEGSIEDIEQYNIYQTTYRTMYKAYQGVIETIGTKKHKVIVDGTKTIKDIPQNIDQQAIVKGDGKSASIAAASILAKVYRDRKMRQLAQEYPQYMWDKNKGYATKEHIEAIRKYGRCEYHRQSFKVKGLDYVKA